MNDSQILADNIKQRITFEYIDRKRMRSKRHVDLLQIIEGDTNAGKHRIWLKGKDLDDFPGPAKTFNAHHIVRAYDNETGEVFDTPKDFIIYLLNNNNGQPFREWPSEVDNRIRVADISVEFNESGMADGWRFGVVTSFRPALDILWTKQKLKNKEEKRFWTQGRPPMYAFDVGDVFYSPARPAKGEKWSLFKCGIEESIMVLDVYAEPESDQTITNVHIDWFDGGKITRSEDRRIPQNELAEILKNGL